MSVDYNRQVTETLFGFFQAFVNAFKQIFVAWVMAFLTRVWAMSKLIVGYDAETNIQESGNPWALKWLSSKITQEPNEKAKMLKSV